MGIGLHTRRAITLSALFLLVMFKFQNCGPTTNLSADPNYSPEIQNEVRIVDRWHESKISFLVESQTVPTQQSTVLLQGLCLGSELQQKIEYQIFSLKELPQLISSGEVDCIRGGFELQLSAVNFESCQEKVQVRAARVGRNDEVAETILQPQCSGG